MNSAKLSRRKLLVTTTIVFTLVMAISYSLTQPANAATTHDVIIFDFAFNPQDTTIQPGDTIQWLNNDPVIYTLWFVYAENEITCQKVGNEGLSEPILPGESWSWTFDEEMTVKYYSFERLWITGFITVQPGVHDVAVISVKAWPTAAPQGQPVYVNVTVENQGDYTETDFNVMVYADRVGASPVHVHIETRTVSLAIGESKLLEFVWDTTGVPYGSYWITAEAILPEDAEPEDNIARTFVGGICVPHQKPEVNILALLLPTVSAILALIALAIAAIVFFKILASPRLLRLWRSQRHHPYKIH